MPLCALSRFLRCARKTRNCIFSAAHDRLAGLRGISGNSTEGRWRHSRNPAFASPQHEVTDLNKASKIIGVTVRNRHNENVGKVHDLVLDPQSGKIAYMVLSSGGVLGLS